MTATTTWYLIVDGSRARVYQRMKPSGPLTEVPGYRLDEPVPRSRDIDADRPGTTMVTGGGMRHAYSPHADAHREAKRQHIRRVVAALEDSCQAKAFDRLVLVAPPQALGDLRHALSADLAGKVVAEIDKDLTRATASDLAGHLAGVI